jgi:hypothetical protein
VLYGEAGDDTLKGGKGNDCLNGGDHVVGDYCNGGVGTEDCCCNCETIKKCESGGPCPCDSE